MLVNVVSFVLRVLSRILPIVFFFILTCKFHHFNQKLYTYRSVHVNQITWYHLKVESIGIHIAVCLYDLAYKNL